MRKTQPKGSQTNEVLVTGPFDLVAPPWHQQAKLIGYGHYSLVFQPPDLVPEIRYSASSEGFDVDEPERFVGLITTEERYQDEIEPSVDLLKRLRLKCQGLEDHTVLPCNFAAGRNHFVLSTRQVQNLVEQHHAVKKRVDYLKTWQEKTLVQVIYPFAGDPLESFYRRPEAAPSWTEFFEGMLGIARCIQSLHAEDYVHGDLSPNNLLFEATEDGSKRFTVVDWNMACKSESFLAHRKGADRVGCWSPEHFSLTTTRLRGLDAQEHWRIYDEEMRKYLKRMLELTLSPESAMVEGAFDRHFETSGDRGKPSGYHEMFDELLAIREDNPSSISKYHDWRYFMDTIAKSVALLFPKVVRSRRRSYHRFVALLLTQNLPCRSPYLANPDSLARRLRLILHRCAASDQEQSPTQEDDSPLRVEETAFFDLLNDLA